MKTKPQNNYFMVQIYINNISTCVLTGNH